MPVVQLALLLLFGLALLVQLWVYIFRFGRVAGYKSAKQANRPQIPVTVIVCAHNESGNLKNLLPRLLEQDYPTFEVLVVDDRSTDYTHTWIEEEQKKDQRLRVLRIDNTPKHFTPKKWALTMGVKHATNEVLLLTDADCEPKSPHWLSAMATSFADDKVKISLGFSQYKKLPGFLNRFIQFETLYTALTYLGAAVARAPYMGVGRNLAYRKSFFLEKKGFLEHKQVLSGDDDLFVNYNATGKNTTVTIGPEAVVLSEPKTSWGSWFSQKKRHWSAGKRYRGASRSLLGFFMLAQWLFWITFILLLSLWIEPYLVLGGFFLRTILLYYLLIRGSIKLGEPFRCWYLLLLDLFLVPYQLVLGVSALFTKQTKWK